MNDFNTKLESALSALNHKQIAFFLWLFSIRALPFLGKNNTFSFWKKSDVLKNIYAIFIALDTSTKAISTNFVRREEQSEILTKNHNGTPVQEIPIHGNVHENITLAAYTTKDVYAHIPTAAVNVAYIVSVLIGDVNSALACTVNLFRSFDIKALKTKNVMLSDIVLEDLKFIKSGTLEKLNNDTSIYGDRWNKFKCTLGNYGCKYWSDFLADIFKSGFRINMVALERRLCVPNNVKNLGAKAVAEHLTALERKEMIGFQSEPKLFVLDFFNANAPEEIRIYKELIDLIFKQGEKSKTPIEMESYIYKRCSECYNTCEEKHDVCPLCFGELATGAGIYPKTEEDKRIFELIEALQDGYNLTCGKCGKIFYSLNIKETCPRCGNENPKSFMPSVKGGIKITQEIIIQKYDSRLSKTKGRKLKIQMHDEKPQNDDTTAMVRQIVDKENNNYEKLVIKNKTGEVIKRQIQPLKEHQGHGSAKPRECQ